MHRARTALGVCMAFCLIWLSATGVSDEVSRHVLDISINLGWVVGMLESEGLTAQNIDHIRNGMSLAATHLHQLWSIFYASGIGVDLSGLYDSILSWESITYYMFPQQKAYWITGLAEQLRAAVSFTVDQRTGALNRATNCNTYFANVGFSFGRSNIAALVSTATGSGSIRYHADQMLYRMRTYIDSGLRTAAATGCCFGDGGEWAALPVLQQGISWDLSAVNHSFGTSREMMQSIALTCGQGPPEPSLWEGRWVATTYGEMELQVSGNTFTGTFGRDNGRVWGTVHGRVIEGSWTTNSQPHGGSFRLELKADDRSFTGRRNHTANAHQWEDWGGIRWWLP